MKNEVKRGNVLQITGSDRALATGFRKGNEKSPRNEIWFLTLPLENCDVPLGFSQLMAIYDVIDLNGIPFDYVYVDDMPYAPSAVYFLTKGGLYYLKATASAKINIPLWLFQGRERPHEDSKPTN